MNLKSLMSGMGTNITRDLDPKSFIDAVMSCPVVTQRFQELGNIASTVQTLLNGYESLLSELESLRSKIEQTEDAINDAQKAINVGQQALTDVLTFRPGTAFSAIPLEGTIVPTGGLEPYQAAVVTANNALNKAKDTLAELKTELTTLEEKIQQYYDAMIEKVNDYISAIANTRIN